MKENERYAAKLLFQFRVVVDGEIGKMRICEERILVFQAKSGKGALRAAKARGRRAEYDYINAQGNPVFFEFVGVLELKSLHLSDSDEEVWYEIRDRLMPMERRAQIIPDEKKLEAIRFR